MSGLADKILALRMLLNHSGAHSDEDICRAQVMLDDIEAALHQSAPDAVYKDALVVWAKPEYAAADAARNKALSRDENDQMGALAAAVDAAITALRQPAPDAIALLTEADRRIIMDARGLSAKIMARLRGHGIIEEDFCCERQDEFEARILGPLIRAWFASPAPDTGDMQGLMEELEQLHGFHSIGGTTLLEAAAAIQSLTEQLAAERAKVAELVEGLGHTANKLEAVEGLYDYPGISEEVGIARALIERMEP